MTGTKKKYENFGKNGVVPPFKELVLCFIKLVLIVILIFVSSAYLSC